MSAQRLVGLALLIGTAACAPLNGTQAPRPIKPEDGPGGSLHVRYSGGLLYRTVDASFRVDQNAYVIVGHLGGDGVIRVIHPTSPIQALRSVRSGQSVPIKSFTAGYDGAPTAFSLTRSPFRNMSAMMDSYDGRGHGFVFMIVTRTLMDIDAITDGFAWDEIDVVDYLHSTDPRLAIREFAESVTQGDSYTIKFANSFTTQSFASYASNAFDCSVLSSLGYGHLSNFWGSWGIGGLSFLGYGGSPYSMRSGCGGSRYASYDYVPRRRSVYIPAAAGPTQPPTEPITPILTRPTKRAIGDASPGVLVGRSALNRPTPATHSDRSSGLQRRPSPSRGDDALDRPSPRSSRPGTRAIYDDYRAASRERGAARPVDGQRASTPRSDPQATRSAPKADAPRPSPAPQRSSPPAATPAKSTAEIKHQ